MAGIGLAVVLGTILRPRFLTVPLGPDEAGFAQVARLWARGEALYGDVAWVDRPQGLLLAYRLVAATSWDPMARLLAVAAAAVAATATGAAAWALAGRRAAVIAAGLFAVVSPAPHLEGFTGNGELLGTAWASCAVAAVAWWTVTGDRRLLVLAGLTGAIGPLMKQSAMDGLVVVIVAVVAVAVRDRESPVRDIVAVLAGVALPLGAVIIHAATIGLGDWWFAMAGHRTQTDSLIRGAFDRRFEQFRDSLGPFARDLGLLAALAVAGIFVAARGRRLTIPLVWLVAAFAGFSVGGLYHVHYWVHLIAPLALLGALALDALAVRSRPIAIAATGAVVAGTLALSAPVYLAGTNDEVAEQTFGDPRVPVADDLGRAVAAITEPHERIAVLWGNVGVYWHADRPPSFRYLWLDRSARSTAPPPPRGGDHRSRTHRPPSS